LKKAYNDGGIKIMISAFGAKEFPTTLGYDAVDCATRLGNFVKDNNLDGVDLDWEDNAAMNVGTGVGEEWLIDFTKTLSAIIPDHILTHAPQAPYFSEESYTQGNYMRVHREVGHLIDFYNIQFYNQEATSYDTYEKLFTQSGSFFPRTSVQEIIDRGVQKEKVVVGKPATVAAAYNTGYMAPSALGAAVDRAYSELGWSSGVMIWQYGLDTDGAVIKGAMENLIEKVKNDQN
jgi:chitinase